MYYKLIETDTRAKREHDANMKAAAFKRRNPQKQYKSNQGN